MPIIISKLNVFTIKYVLGIVFYFSKPLWDNFTKIKFLNVNKMYVNNN